MLRQPGQHRPPDRAVPRQSTTGAAPLKPQRPSQLLGAFALFTRPWSVENPHRLPQADHLRMRSERQIKDGAAAVTEPADQ